MAGGGGALSVLISVIAREAPIEADVDNELLP